MAPVWRADKPGRGRYREFTQFDLDSVGVVSEVADTEIVAGMCDTLLALEVGRYKVRYSSRGILNVLLAYADIEQERGVDVFRVLDKLEKIGPEKVRLELTTGYQDESGDDDPGPRAGRRPGRSHRALPGDSRRGPAGGRPAPPGSVRQGVEGGEEEIRVVERISDHLYALGYEDDRVDLDLSIARGLAYYTGPVFEAMLLDAPEFGSVFGGGRYDDLVMRFLGEKVPATGASIGVDRLLTALIHLGKAGERKATARVLVAVIDPELRGECLKMTYELRRAGIPTELYLGGERGIGKQLKYADQWEIPDHPALRRQREGARCRDTQGHGRGRGRSRRRSRTARSGSRSGRASARRSAPSWWPRSGRCSRPSRRTRDERPRRRWPFADPRRPGPGGAGSRRSRWAGRRRRPGGSSAADARSRRSSSATKRPARRSGESTRRHRPRLRRHHRLRLVQERRHRAS